MTAPAILRYRLLVSKDPETGTVVAEIPALHIADSGADVPEALERLQAMLTFHLECLQEEGKPVPTEEGQEEGFCLRVRLPAHAAQTAPGAGDYPQAGAGGIHFSAAEGKPCPVCSP